MLTAQGRNDLKGSKHKWMYTPQNMSTRQWLEFKGLRESSLKTSRALGHQRDGNVTIALPQQEMG